MKKRWNIKINAIGSILNENRNRCNCGNYTIGKAKKCIQCQSVAITKRNKGYEKLVDKAKYGK